MRVAIPSLVVTVLLSNLPLGWPYGEVLLTLRLLLGVLPLAWLCSLGFREGSTAFPAPAALAGTLGTSFGLALSFSVLQAIATGNVAWDGLPAETYFALPFVPCTLGIAARSRHAGKCVWAVPVLLGVAIAIWGAVALVGWERPLDPMAVASPEPSQNTLVAEYALLVVAVVLHARGILLESRGGLFRAGAAVLISSAALSALAIGMQQLGWGGTQRVVAWAVLAALPCIFSGGRPASGNIQRPYVAVDQLFLDHGLTSREETAIRGLDRGLTVSQLADEMGVARSTAGTYCKRAYEKLGVTSRDAAIALLDEVREQSGECLPTAERDDTQALCQRAYRVSHTVAASCIGAAVAIYWLPWLGRAHLLISQVDDLRPGTIVLGLLVIIAAAGTRMPISKRGVVALVLALAGGLAGYSLFGNLASWGTDALSVAAAYALPILYLDGISRDSHALGNSRQRAIAALGAFALAAVALLLPLSIRRWYMAALLAVPGVLFAQMSGGEEGVPKQAFSPFPPVHIAVGLCALGASAPILVSALQCFSPGPVEASIAYGLIAIAVIVLLSTILGALEGGGLSRLLPSLAVEIVGLCLGWLWVLTRETPNGVAVALRTCLGCGLAVVGLLAFARLVRLFKRRARLACLSVRERWREVGTKTGLTEGEIEAIILLGRGYSVSYVARSLSLSPAAIASRRASAYKKLGIHRRDELARMLLDLLRE